ncbi:hypothetical protein DFH07DRAFT_526108 [Mycena maculata]|uniref:Cell division cycle protein 123 n=1 Tax=Mycena maculata TaxID=230809 RepID=A0AAD7IZ88_9AGAR|nr:hypothetical protein DFH07DRAFT_526108 [Mycena maculata]
MSLLESIRAGRPLRKVGIEHDTSAPSLIDTLEITDKYDARVAHANIENWGSALAEFTPKTILVPLSLAQGSLLLSEYKKLENAQEAVDAAAAAYVASGRLSSLSAVAPEEDTLLAALGPQIQAAINEMSGADGTAGCFMKLSSRSPKDAAARSGVFEAYYARAARAERELDDERKLWILCESESAALRFSDAASVIRALVLSERVWQDMTLAMRHPDTWQQNVILRKWEPVPIDMEFRTFVANGRMTAISQYAYQLCSPRLTDPAELARAVAAVRKLHAALHPILAARGFGDCVLDFGVIPASEGEWGATFIEMNPFEETTDGGLFSWVRERAVIEGTAPAVEYPAVRVTERRRTGALAMVPRGWKEVMAKVERAS